MNFETIVTIVAILALVSYIIVEWDGLRAQYRRFFSSKAGKFVGFLITLLIFATTEIFGARFNLSFLWRTIISVTLVALFGRILDKFSKDDLEEN